RAAADADGGMVGRNAGIGEDDVSLGRGPDAIDLVQKLERGTGMAAADDGERGAGRRLVGSLLRLTATCPETRGDGSSGVDDIRPAAGCSGSKLHGASRKSRRGCKRRNPMARCRHEVGTV